MTTEQQSLGQMLHTLSNPEYKVKDIHLSKTNKQTNK